MLEVDGRRTCDSVEVPLVARDTAATSRRSYKRFTRGWGGQCRLSCCASRFDRVPTGSCSCWHSAALLLGRGLRITERSADPLFTSTSKP